MTRLLARMLLREGLPGISMFSNDSTKRYGWTISMEDCPPTNRLRVKVSRAALLILHLPMASHDW